jgi:hypothetical protein
LRIIAGAGRVGSHRTLFAALPEFIQYTPNSNLIIPRALVVCITIPEYCSIFGEQTVWNTGRVRESFRGMKEHFNYCGYLQFL